MAVFRNITTATLDVPSQRTVIAPSANITVADKDAVGFAMQPTVWQAIDTAAVNAVAALSGAAVPSGGRHDTGLL